MEDLTEETSSSSDLWTAPDKFYHLLFCFSLTIIFSLLLSHSRFPYPFLRRRSLSIASFLSLLAGAAKEFADYLGFFNSSGASSRDAVADALGVFLACLLLSLSKSLRRKSKPKPEYPDGVALV